MRKIILPLALAFTTFSAFAQQVSVDEARERASAFLKQQGPRRAPAHKTQAQTPSEELTLAYTSQREGDMKVCFYVFNQPSAAGFVIIGGDEAAEHILGYCEEGSFDYDSAPSNVKWWLSQYTSQISAAIDQQVTAGAKSRVAPRRTQSASRTDIGPLIQTKWNQYAPYNNAVNAAFKEQTDSKLDLLTGCTATAMAQIMKYYECPATTGTGSASATSQNYSGFTPSADFAATTYDWSNMLNVYNKNSYSDVEGEAVATLMYHAGVSIGVTYDTSGNGGTSGVSSNIPSALVNYFGYDKTARYESRDYYTDNEWEAMIYKELSENRPVFYGGFASSDGKSGGHQFICDGYRTSDGLYSINWGWGGLYDGFFAITGANSLKPDGSGAGGAGENASYSYHQSAVVGVRPNAGGLESPLLREYNTGTLRIIDNVVEEYKSYDHTHGASEKILTLKASVWNLSKGLSTFTLGVKATDTTTGLEYYWICGEKDLPYSHLNNYNLQFDVNKLPFNGIYSIRPVCRNVNSISDKDWHNVEILIDGGVIPTVTVTGATDPEKTDVTFSIDSEEIQVSRTTFVKHNSSYAGAITYTSSNTDVAVVDNNGVVTAVAKGEATITAAAAGNTYFNETTATFDITVVSFAKNKTVAEISATGIVTGQTAQITIAEGYDGTPTFVSDNPSVATVSDEGVVTGVMAGTAKITVTLPETTNYYGATVEFDVTVSEPALIFSKAPYFSNDNNIWERDMKLNIPIYNGSGTGFNGKFFALIRFGNGSGVICTLGWEDSYTFPSGASYDYVLDLERYQEYFEAGKDTPCTISFYHDVERTQPFNIPSITYTYRETANIEFSMTAAGYATLILPFDAKIPSDKYWKAYECLSTDGNTLLLSEVSTLKRNTPYIISGKDQGTYTFTGPNAIDADAFTSGFLTGVFKEYQTTGGEYVLQKQSATGKVGFFKVGSEVDDYKPKVGANRAYLTMPSPLLSKSLLLPEEEEPTVIESIASPSSSAGIYDLNGRRLNYLQKGLNIVNGKKVYVK